MLVLSVSTYYSAIYRPRKLALIRRELLRKLDVHLLLRTTLPLLLFILFGYHLRYFLIKRIDLCLLFLLVRQKLGLLALQILHYLLLLFLAAAKL